MNFNLDVEKYNIGDIYDIFNIEKNIKLEKVLLNNKYNNLIYNINDSDMNYSEKENIKDFLEQLYNKLLIIINHDDSILMNKPKLFSKTYNVSRHHIIKPNDNDVKHINHIDNTEITTLLNINTKFRKNYNEQTSTNFHFELSNILKNVISITLLSIQIPKNTNYPISSKLNTNEFTIEFYTWNTNTNSIVGDITEYTITIPNGNYTAIQLSDYLNNNTFNDDNNNNLKGIKSSFNTITNKFTFNRDIDGLAEPGNSEVYRFNIDWGIKDNSEQPIQLNLGWLIGFRSKRYEWDNYNINDNNNDIGYNPEGIYFGYSQYYMLAIDDYNKNYTSNIVSPFQESVFIDNNILAKIPINAEPMLNYSDVKTQPKRIYFGPVNINKIKVTLLDEFGRVVDINNSDYSFTLKIEQLYDINVKK